MLPNAPQARYLLVVKLSWKASELYITVAFSLWIFEIIHIFLKEFRIKVICKYKSKRRKKETYFKQSSSISYNQNSMHSPPALRAQVTRSAFIHRNKQKNSVKYYCRKYIIKGFCLFWKNALLLSQICSPIFFGKMLSRQNALKDKSILPGEHFAK